MEEIIIHFRCYSGLGRRPKPHSLPCQIPQIPTISQNAPPRTRPLPARGLSLSPRAPISLPEMPLKPPNPTTTNSSSSFHDKALFLDSLGIDLLALASAHPPLAAAPLDGIRATVALLRSIGLNPPELRRASGMCPEILASPPDAILPALTFLLREAGVTGRELRHAVHRRPRLLVSDVPGRLRPTLYFLQTLGITAISRHTDLLSCSVEDKLLPRLDFLERAGLSHRDARAMARRFPQIFCYSIEGNLKPKFEFFVDEMRRDLMELREFPQYFSFSLHKRIQRRHSACKDKGVFLQLPALLRPSDEQFQARLEVCVSSSQPLRRSPLWQEGLNYDC